MTTTTRAQPYSVMTARARTSGLVMAVASALAFSSSGPFVKPLLEAGWSLGAALLVRMGVAGVVLAPALYLAMRRERGFLRRHWVLIVGFGLTAVAGCQLQNSTGSFFATTTGNPAAPPASMWPRAMPRRSSSPRIGQ